MGLLFGCSSGSGGTGGGAATCGTFANTASIVSKTANPNPTPAFTGGTIADGTYEKTAIINYGTTTPGTTRHQETWLLAGGNFQTVAKNPADMIEKRNAATITTSGSTLTMNLFCGLTGTLNAQYSATATEIRFSSTANEVHVYTRVGTVSDAGTTDGGPTLETIATSLTNLVDLDLDSTDVYVLGNSEVRKCALGGCGANASLVSAVSNVSSSLAVGQGTLFVGTGFRYLSSCALGATCTLTDFVDVGINSYPTGLWIANGRIYWISEAGTSRRIQVCPLAGCSAGYPKFVYQGTLLDGVAVGGLVLNGTDAFVLSFTGGVYRIPLTDNETGNAAGAIQVSPSAYGSGGLDLDGTTLRWLNVVSGKLESCEGPTCAAVTEIKSGLVAPAGLRANATHVYGITRGTPTGANSWAPMTAGIWRYPR